MREPSPDQKPSGGRASWRRPAAIGVAVAVLLSMAWRGRQAGFAPAAAAVAMEPARVRVSVALLDEALRRVLPVEVLLAAAPPGAPGDAGVPSPLAPAVLSLTELRYCGVTDKGNGRWRAVLRTTLGGGAVSPLLTGDEACRQGLGELSKGLRAQQDGEDGVGIAEVESVWRTWELRLVLARLAGLGPGKPGAPRPLAGLENRRDLLVVSTANLRVPTDAGETLTFHAAPSFSADGVEVAVFFGENGAGPPGGRISASLGHGAPVIAGANVAADLPQAFANQILRQLTAARPVAIPVDRDVVDVQQVSVAGNATGLLVTGLATPRSMRETVRLTVQAGGDELRVMSIRGEAQLESCAGLGTMAALGCNARNAARNAAAAALGAALTQKFQGQLVRDLAGEQTVRVDFARHRLELRGALLRVAAGARGTMVGAHLAVSGGAGH